MIVISKDKGLTYRADYFKKNNGIGNIDMYICAYCCKLCIGKGSVQIDHIYPKSKMYLKASKNATANLVTSCPKCNQKKSNKVTPLYIARGYIAKVFQTVLYSKIGIILLGLIMLMTARNLRAQEIKMGVFVAPLILGLSFGFNKRFVWATVALAVAAVMTGVI